MEELSGSHELKGYMADDLQSITIEMPVQPALGEGQWRFNKCYLLYMKLKLNSIQRFPTKLSKEGIKLDVFIF